MSTLSNYLIPLENFSQQFQISLSGTLYNLTVKWNASPDSGWVLDIADLSDNPIVAGLALITGADILEGLEYLNFAGSLYIVSNGSNPDAVPTLDNLGSNSNLYFQTSVAS